MLNLALLFAVIVSLQNGVYSATTQDIDVDTILEIIRAQQQIEREGDRRSSSSSDSSDYDSGSDDSRYGTLRSGEIVNLIQQDTNERGKAKKHKSDQERYDRYNIGEMSNLLKLQNKPYMDDVRDQSFPIEQFLEQLLSQSSNVKNRKIKPRLEVRKQKVKPNNLLKSLNFKSSREDSLDSLDKYSKIYVILNPQAIQKSKNKKNLTDLIAQIVSLSESAQKEDHEDYHGDKGFSVRNSLFSRRSRHDSKEMYGGRDSLEDDFKQKRSRNGGSGGGNAGRTAIPYIRHRGDIYERDN